MASDYNPNTFTDNPLDRASHLRIDDEWLSQARLKPGSRVVPLQQLKPLMVTSVNKSEASQIGWVSPENLDGFDLSESLFLGIESDCAYFALDVSDADEQQLSAITAESNGSFTDLLMALASLEPGDASILAQAKSMIDWHQRHGFCAKCGTATLFAEAGYRRDCPQCESQHFPRTDPVVIALVLKDGKCLLGRNAAFKWPMFTALAGFMEPGETVEEAVAREVKEEVGVEIGRVHYHSTQPWPYPSSLMIGCIAEATTAIITVDETEIAEARWFSKQELRAVLQSSGPFNYQQMISGAVSFEDGDFFLPPPSAIAYQLIKSWLEQD